MRAVLMAGGKGTRIQGLNDLLPKPMLPLHGKPILEYQIEILKKQGFKDITIVVGHLKEKIIEYFGDGKKMSPIENKAFGVNISYIIEKEPLGTAGSLYYLKDIAADNILLINGDIIFDIDIDRFYNFHKQKKALASIFTHPNNHPYDSGLVVTDDEKRVIKWMHKEEKRGWYKNRVNAGIHILSKKIINQLDKIRKMDLDREILKPLIQGKHLFAYDSPEYAKDMGTPERFYEVEKDFTSGKISARNLKYKQKAVFLDRDGTINIYKGFLKDINDFELINGVPEAISSINNSNYLVIVVTNQPVIARGDISFEELAQIHNKLETILGESACYLDDIIYCPHHPDAGFDGERSEYKMQCKCRKPNPGMLLEASEKYNIDLTASWMIGDSYSDIIAGRSAGCNVAYIGKNADQYGCKNFSSVLDFTKYLFKDDLMGKNNGKK